MKCEQGVDCDLFHRVQFTALILEIDGNLLGAYNKGTTIYL